MMLAAGSLLAADAKDEVTSAAKKLADADNYAWHQATENAGGNGGGGGGRRFGGGPVDGKTQKDGYTVRSMTFGDNTMQTVTKGEKGAMQNQDGDWMSFEEMAQNFGGGGGGGGGARRFGAFKAPAAEAQDLVGKVSSLKESGGAFSGDLTEAGAKEMLVPAMMRGGDGGGPEVSGAKASVTFWVTDGVLSKYQTKVQGTVSFNGNDREINRTTTVEIKDVGKTTVTVPEEAKKKLS